MEQTNKLEIVKNLLINTALKWLMFFLVIYNIIQTTRINSIGIQPLLFYSYFGFALLLTIYLFRDKLNYKLKGQIYVYFIFILSIITFLNYGAFSGGPLWLILASAFSSLILSKRTTFWISTLGVLFAVVFFILHGLDIIILNFNVHDLEKSFDFWGLFVLEAVFVIYNIFYGFKSLYKSLLDNQKEIEARNKKLLELNLKLEEEIENRIKIESALKKSEKLFKSIFFAAGDGAFLYQNKKIIDCNEKALKLFGATKEQFFKLHPWDISPEFQSDGESSKKKGLRILNESMEGNPIQFEWKHKKMNGELFDAEVSLNIVNYDKVLFLAIVRDITERKHAEKILKESEERYRRLSEATFEAIVISREGKFIDVNNQLERIYGYSPEEFMQKTFADIIYPDDLELVLYNVKNKITEPYIHRAIKKDGSIIYLETSGKSFTINNEDYRLSVLSDITKYKETLSSLEESENRYKRLADATFEAIIISKDAIIIDGNKQVEAIFGYERTDFIGKNLGDFILKEDLNLVLNKVKNKNSDPYVFRGIKKDGSIIYLETSAKYFRIDESEFRLAVLRDITKYREAVSSLEESEEKYRTLFEKANDGIILCTNQKVTDCNEKVLEMLNTNYDEFIGREVESIILLTEFNGVFDKKKAKEIFSKAEIAPQTAELKIKRSDESYRFLEINLNSIGIINGEHGLIGFIRDITDRKKAVQAVISSEKKFRNIFNSVFDSIFILDLEGKFLEVNDASAYLFGYSREEFKEMKIDNVIANKQYDKSILIKDFVAKSNLGTYEIDYYTKDNKIFNAESISTRTKFNEIDAVIVVSRDITQRKQIQRYLYSTMVESEEKERERYAKELHDGLGPLISTCKIYFHTIKDMPDRIAMKDHITRAGELLEDALQSIKEISNNLSPHILRNYGLKEAIRSFVEKIKSASEIEFIIESNLTERLPELIEFTVYRSYIELINNSIKYSNAKRVLIRIRTLKNILIVEYKDDGNGFDYEKIKDEKKGFGLFNLENRIKEIGGKFNYYSMPGKGVIVEIMILNIDLWLK